MIAQLTGRVAYESESGIVLDVHGVGYDVFCSRHTRGDIVGIEGTVTVFIDTIVREEFIHLYGFASLEEKSCFQLLRSVQGVGNRMAIAILSLFRPLELVHVLQAQDKASLTRADGVGPKLATRLVTELKDKAGTMALPRSIGIRGDHIPSPLRHDEVVSALTNLGYTRNDAARAVQQVVGDNPETGDESALIRACLRHLAQR
ncbi:MAG: Holliday junction branch migration protein RuvA [Alphaproteobacteria bacterium]|nr:MAG: Holliday junction branch migration protein RuvA [Alphaproteobacteria bacterium]